MRIYSKVHKEARKKEKKRILGIHGNPLHKKSPNFPVKTRTEACFHQGFNQHH